MIFIQKSAINIRMITHFEQFVLRIPLEWTIISTEPLLRHGSIMNKLELFFEQLLPFILAGIALALVVGLVVVFSYVLLWGVLLGFVIWIIYFVKNLFSRSRSTKKKDGNIIEHDDFK